MNKYLSTTPGAYIVIRDHRGSECVFHGVFASLQDAFEAVESHSPDAELEWSSAENPFGSAMKQWSSWDGTCTSLWFVLQADHSYEHAALRRQRFLDSQSS